MDEREAVSRLKRGDVGGLENLVRAHYTRAVRAAYLIVRDRSLAEDVVQSSFVRAYEKIDQFDAARPFGPWFVKIVVNDAVAAARRRERTAPSPTGSADDLLGRLVDPSDEPHEEAEEADERRRVWAALQKRVAAWHDQVPPARRAQEPLGTTTPTIPRAERPNDHGAAGAGRRRSRSFVEEEE